MRQWFGFAVLFLGLLGSSATVFGQEDISKPGWRNPGGVGRHKEWYPAGNRFQNPGRPSVAAQFDTIPSINRQAQMQAQMIGIQRSRALQEHIDSYARPYFFPYGLGFGYGRR